VNFIAQEYGYSISNTFGCSADDVRVSLDQSQTDWESALDSGALQLWSLIRFPMPDPMYDPIGQRPAIGLVTSLKRPWYTHEFNLYLVTLGMN